jgi:hypothetical protein
MKGEEDRSYNDENLVLYNTLNILCHEVHFFKSSMKKFAG